MPIDPASRPCDFSRIVSVRSNQRTWSTAEHLGSITVSIQVPRTYGGSPTAPTRLATQLEVSIYNVRGQLVRVLRKGSDIDDVVTLRWDGTDSANTPAPSGVYFVRAVAGGSESVGKIVLIR